MVFEHQLGDKVMTYNFIPTKAGETFSSGVPIVHQAVSVYTEDRRNAQFFESLLLSSEIL